MTFDSIQAMHGRSATDVWVVGHKSGAAFAMHYDGAGWVGEITVQRIVPDNVALCEALF